MTRLLLPLIALVATAVACGSISDEAASSTTVDRSGQTTPSTPAAGPDQHPSRAQWEAQNVDSYAYTYVRNCECSDEARGPFRVVVADGAVARVESFGSPVEVAGYTVEELFGLIDEAEADGKQTAVSYHPTSGHPLSVSLDLEAMAVDGGWSIEISSFTDLSGPKAELEAARARWAAAGVTDYRMTYRQICFCPQIVRTVVVEDGVVTETIDSGDVILTEAGHTVESLFGDLEVALAAPVFELRVAYDPELGHPVDLYVDVEQFMADEEWGVVVEGFEISSAG